MVWITICAMAAAITLVSCTAQAQDYQMLVEEQSELPTLPDANGAFGVSPQVRSLQLVQANVLFDSDTGEVVGMLGVDPVGLAQFRQERTFWEGVKENWKWWTAGTVVTAVGGYLIYDKNKGGGGGGGTTIVNNFHNQGDGQVIIGENNTQSGRSDNNSMNFVPPPVGE